MGTIAMGIGQDCVPDEAEAGEPAPAASLQHLGLRLESIDPAPSGSSVGPDLTPVLDLWEAAKKPGGFLEKGDVDPLPLPPALWKYLILLARAPDNTDCRIRLIGTHICKLLDFDPTGMLATDVLGKEHGRRVIRDVSRMMETSRVPVHFRLGLLFESFEILVDAVLLPVGSATDGLSGAFGGVICEHRKKSRSRAK